MDFQMDFSKIFEKKQIQKGKKRLGIVDMHDKLTLSFDAFVILGWQSGKVQAYKLS